ncbi:hypothetical protein [Burkholderia stagnalis]|uniref:hypothetical protein n=1 Tax=Burkholderia stagnalis TaxID=1503054 RepID=UPI0012DA5543|nr:hypothetical protein [Burkholderia stagnalis]
MERNSPADVSGERGGIYQLDSEIEIGHVQIFTIVFMESEISIRENNRVCLGVTGVLIVTNVK